VLTKILIEWLAALLLHTGGAPNSIL